MNRSVSVVVSVVMAVGLMGCSAGRDTSPSTSQDASAPADAEGVRTTFTRIAPSGYVDMSLEVHNPTARPVTMSGRLVARGEDGAVLPQVSVTTAFGTEQGRAVLMPGVAVDFVQVRGAGSEDVRDVTVEDAVLTPHDTEVTRRFVDLVPLDGVGRELEQDSTAVAARLDNPNAVDARIRVVLVVLPIVREGVPQQASLVHDVTTVRVPANAVATVDLDDETRTLLRRYGRNAFVSLRPVPAP